MLAEIVLRLPHRYPFLLVDRVIEFAPGERITAIKAVTASEMWLRDSMYFPPALVIESWCQAAALLVVWDAPHPTVLDGEVPLLGTLSRVEFHALAEPGSVLIHRARLVRDLGTSFIFEGETTVDGQHVLRIGQMVMAIRPVAAVVANSGPTSGKTGCVDGI